MGLLHHLLRAASQTNEREDKDKSAARIFTALAPYCYPLLSCYHTDNAAKLLPMGMKGLF